MKLEITLEWESISLGEKMDYYFKKGLINFASINQYGKDWLATVDLRRVGLFFKLPHQRLFSQKVFTHKDNAKHYCEEYLKQLPNS